jgi:uncharacterized protein (DUF488 family)
MAYPFFTVGHSNRTLQDFVELLLCAEIRTLVDIRKMPRSRANPQFNEETFPGTLRNSGIAYEREAGLGGFRPRNQSVSEVVNGFWKNRSFHQYADYALSNDFQDALNRLIDHGQDGKSAVMCSEAVWWRCHRRIVADYLLARGETVLHVMSRERFEPAHLTPCAVIQSDGRVVYPDRGC